MVFFVVQLDSEDSVSVVREAKLAHIADEDITRGMTVQVLNFKGRSVLCKETGCLENSDLETSDLETQTPWKMIEILNPV